MGGIEKYQQFFMSHFLVKSLFSHEFITSMDVNKSDVLIRFVRYSLGVVIINVQRPFTLILADFTISSTSF